MPAEELAGRIAERVHVHETEKMALDERIGQREGDMPYDVRVGDGFETLGELQSRRAFHAERARRPSALPDEVVVRPSTSADVSSHLPSETRTMVNASATYLR